jgi:hypothetical protein
MVVTTSGRQVRDLESVILNEVKDQFSTLSSKTPELILRCAQDDRFPKIRLT